jgi:hypothetical protein
MESIPAEYAARIAALEEKVAQLYRHLGVVEPSAAEAVRDRLPEAARELARAGQREEAIRSVLVSEGVSTVDATALVDGYLRSIGH